MTFGAILQDAVSQVDGALGAIMLDGDGIAVDEVRADPNLDLAIVAAEYSTILRETQRTGTETGIGLPEEITVRSSRTVLIIRRAGDGYFVVLALSPEANFGKGRFVLRRAVARLEEEL